jgi:stress-induced morphogen
MNLQMPMSADAIKQRIRENMNAEEVVLHDLTGGGDHWQVIVVSQQFEGKPLIQQHKMVLDLFTKDIATNHVHALSVKTYTPERWKQVQEKA